MKNIKKLFTWYFMFTKRLFHRGSFLLILLMIPISIPCAKIAMEQDSGILTVALYSEDKNDAIANEIIEKLMTDESVVRHIVYDDMDDAISAVQRQEIDAVWVFEDEMEKRISEYVKGVSDEPLVTVVAIDYRTRIQIANEKLFSALHPYISYSAFENYLYSEDVIPATVSKETVREHYDRYDYEGSIVKFSRLDATDDELVADNYLTAPIRGILSLIIVMCGVASAMYFLTDMAEGRYDWLSYKKRMAPAFGSCLASSVVSSIAVLIALFVSGIAADFMEIAAMLVYIFAVTGFSLLLCTVFRSPGKLGATIPGFLIVMFVMCPIFFNVNFLGWFRWLLPPYYYLNAVTRADYILYMAVYSVCSYILAYVLNILLNKNLTR